MSPTLESRRRSPRRPPTSPPPRGAGARRAPSRFTPTCWPARPGSGKAVAARALAAELLADGAADPDDARRRALADPSPHPDLVWLRPPGTQHLVEEVRERVIGAVAYRPFEGERRVFVIEAAEAMAEESQNALLKTLEEPPAFAHLILISAEPEALLETVRSRCRPVPLRPPVARGDRIAPRRLEPRGPLGRRRSRSAAPPPASPAATPTRAAFLVSRRGPRAARRGRAARAARSPGASSATHPGRTLPRRPSAPASTSRPGCSRPPRAPRRTRPSAPGRPPSDARGSPRSRRSAPRDAPAPRPLDLGLALLAAWLRDLAAAGDGAAELVLTADRVDEIEEVAGGVDPRRARRAAELVMDTRRRLTVNVSEPLALEALAFRLEFLLAERGDNRDMARSGAAFGAAAAVRRPPLSRGRVCGRGDGHRRARLPARLRHRRGGRRRAVDRARGRPHGDARRPDRPPGPTSRRPRRSPESPRRATRPGSSTPTAG